jgi:hypothetical protein
MIILSIAITIFIVVIAMLIYSNWKSTTDMTDKNMQQGCGCGRKCPCSKCGSPPNTCGCPYKPKCQGGCSFC